MLKSIRGISILALGISLFTVLSLCIQVPVFENYYICLGYVVVTMYCFLFGPAAGSIVGFFGVILYCLLTSGLRGMPGWAIGNVVIGILLGYTIKATYSVRMKSSIRLVILSIASVAITALAMLVVKSGVEVILYAQPMILRVANNFYAFVADSVVLIISIPICNKVIDLVCKYVFKTTFYCKDFDEYYKKYIKQN